MRSYTSEELVLILDTADALKLARAQRDFPEALAKRNIALIFTAPSCRTRSALAVAAFDEGASVEYFSAQDIRFGLKESPRDIARVLSRLFDGIAVRGVDENVLRILRDSGGVPIWNCLGPGFHPTQTLADLMTIREVFGRLGEIQITYVGDGRNNVARSLMIAAQKFGLDLRILSPVPLQPSEAELDAIPVETPGGASRITVTDDPHVALRGSAVVYGDVWVSMGEEDHIEDRIQTLKDYKVTTALMELTERSDSIYLHCLPAIHDLETEFAMAHPLVAEVDDAVFEGPASRVFDQAENRLHTIKALMVLTVAS